MDVAALIRGHQCLPPEAGSEMRDDDRDGGKASCHRRQRERIAETKVKRRRKSELLPDADGQHATVDEHHRAVLGSGGENFPYSLVVQSVAVHRGKETNASQPLLAKGTGEARRDLAGSRIEHEEPDEP